MYSFPIFSPRLEVEVFGIQYPYPYNNKHTVFGVRLLLMEMMIS